MQKTLEKVRFVETGGVMWYRLRDVLEALDVEVTPYRRRAAGKLIGKNHKCLIWSFGRTKSGKLFYDKRFAYIDRTGVERLVIRFSGTQSRSELMDTLESRGKAKQSKVKQ